MAVHVRQPVTPFDPATFESLRFVAREIDDDGHVTLRYALDEKLEFVERFELPPGTRVEAADRARIDGLLALLHWVAGVSYYKTAVPPDRRCETGAPPPATAALLEALYSEGLGEFAVVEWARPRCRARASPSRPAQPAPRARHGPLRACSSPSAAARTRTSRWRSCVGRASSFALFSVGDAPPIERTAEVAGLPRLLVRAASIRALRRSTAAGALNGHVPITAIVSCVALLTAALNGFDAVALANERSASSGQRGLRRHRGQPPVLQERARRALLRGAVAEVSGAVEHLLGAAPRLGARRSRARSHG